MSGKRIPQEPPPEQPQKEDEADRSYSVNDEGDLYMEINLSGISENLQCPICLGILRNTKTVMECLHRFCGECIEKSIRLCKNECPICLEQIPGGCTLGDDRVYDHMISIIFPDIDKYEEDSVRSLREEIERKQKVKTIAETFARRRRRIVRNVCEDQISNDKGMELLSDAEKTKAEANKD